MKTVLIFDQCGQEPVQFLVVDGDRSHLNDLYGNASDNDKALEQELYSLVYTADWCFVPGFTPTFPVQEVIDGAKVIVCGFLP